MEQFSKIQLLPVISEINPPDRGITVQPWEQVFRIVFTFMLIHVNPGFRIMLMSYLLNIFRHIKWYQELDLLTFWG
jgi:hypothetical protein